MAVMSFAEALADSAEVPGEKHLLLGNGFSIACRPDAFRYDRLVEEADFSRLGVSAEALFGLQGTSDFERVIEALRTSARILTLYDDRDDASLIARLEADGEVLRDALADVLSKRHPDNVGSITPEEYGAARTFLANFSGRLFTVSYDLLLYWTLLQDMEPAVLSDDGFRTDPSDPDADWVTWDGFAGHSQRVFHLHGGLHLYDAGSFLKKLTWRRSGIALVDQIRDALSRAIYPLVVTEGSSAEKLARIEHSPYLHRGLKSLTNCGGTLFVYGHSLDANDDHVLRRIEKSNIEALYVSLYGDPDSDANHEIQHRAQMLSEHRDLDNAEKPARYRRSLAVRFYDAASAAVWTP